MVGQQDCTEQHRPSSEFTSLNILSLWNPRRPPPWLQRMCPPPVAMTVQCPEPHLDTEGALLVKSPPLSHLSMHSIRGNQSEIALLGFDDLTNTYYSKSRENRHLNSCHLWPLVQTLKDLRYTKTIADIHISLLKLSVMVCSCRKQSDSFCFWDTARSDATGPCQCCLPPTAAPHTPPPSPHHLSLSFPSCSSCYNHLHHLSLPEQLERRCTWSEGHMEGTALQYPLQSASAVLLKRDLFWCFPVSVKTRLLCHLEQDKTEERQRSIQYYIMWVFPGR